MTMSSSVSKVTLLGDGVQTSWPFAFKVWKAADLEIAITNQDGVTTVVSNWSVTLASVGGTVTYPSAGAPLPLGHKITIKRSMDFLQDVDLVSGTRWDPEVVETALDQATAERQELKERLDRSIAVDIASGESPDALLASIYEAKDTAVDNAAAALAFAERAEQAASTVAYYSHEGTLLGTEDTITLPWAYDTSVGVEVYLSGVKQAESTLTFTDPYTVTLDDAVSADTPFEVVASAGARSDLGALLESSAGAAMVGSGSRTVKARLDDVPHRNDYADEAAFITGVNASTNDGFWVDGEDYSLPAGKIHRLRDRVFIGDAVDFDGKWGGSGNNYAPIPRWPSRETTCVVHSPVGRIALSGLSKSSLNLTDPSGGPSAVQATIGIIGIGVADYAGADLRNAWGGYFEAWRATSVAHAAFGVEISVGNDGGNQTNQGPFTEYGSGVFGLNIAAGGSKGSAYAQPSSCAIIIGNNTQTFNKGIVFGHDSITGTNGTTGNGIAIAMAKGHTIGWYTSDEQLSSQIFSNVAASANRVSLELADNAVRPLGSGGNILATFENVASSVNYVRLIPGTTGNGPEIRAGGANTDADLKLTAKGTGLIRFGTWTSNADAAVNGYVTIKDSAGTTRKLATIA